ncbi:MAG: ABC transporter substrate-binding protein [Thermoplasmata archaeon]
MEESAPAAPSSSRGTWIAVAAFVIGIAIGAAGVFGGQLLFPPAVEAEIPIIGSVVAVTGALEIFGPTIRLGIDLARDEINAAGGVLGQDIVTIHEDSGSVPAVSITAASKLINVDGVQAIIGALASDASLPVTQGVTTPGRVVQMSPASTSVALTFFNEGLSLEDRFFFRTAPTDLLQGAAAGVYAFETKGWRDVAILARADPYGSGLAQKFQDTFEGLGGTITARVDYDITATVFDTELATVFNSGLEALWWVPFPLEGELILSQWLAATGANPDWLLPEWLWAEGVRSSTFVDTVVGLGIPVQGMEGTAPLTSLAASDNLAIFNTAFAAANPDAVLQLFEPQSYDSMYLIALAMQMGGGVDSETIRANLRAVSSPPGTIITPGNWSLALTEIAAGNDINYEGASGFVNFDAFGDVGSDYEVWTINETGKIVHKLRILESDIPSPVSPSYVPAARLVSGWMPQAAVTRD